MPLLVPHQFQTTHQLWQVKSAQVNSQLAVKRMTAQPQWALQTQANIDLQAVLALLHG